VKIKTNFGTIYRDWEIIQFPEKVFFQEGPGLREWQWTQLGMKVINVTNIMSDGRVDISNTKRFISIEEFSEKYSHFAVQAGDIVLASSGNTYGKVGRINQTHLPLMMNTSVIRFHPKPNSFLDTDYLYSFMRSNYFKNQIESLVIGSAQPNFGPAHLKQMRLIYPPLPVQRKIAAILTAYDDLIENNQRRIKILEEMAQMLYREWFIKFRFPGHEKAKMVDSLLGMIPSGWEIKQFGEIVTIVRRGINPYEFEDEMFAHFSIPAYDEGQLPKFELGPTILSNKHLIEQDCVLLSKLNPRIPRVWLPFAGNSHRAISSTEFLILKPRPTITRIFLFAKCKSEEFQQLFGGRASGTSTSHQRVKLEDFDKLPELVPPFNLVSAFSKLVGPLYLLSHNLRSKNAKLRETRDLLLPKFISGETDVSDLDIKIEDTV
jgi:type I restriction enzyme, S subunit